VQITPDFTTPLDITLRTEAVQLNEVVVEAQRPLLQRDATNTTRFISAEDISRLPTRGYQDAAAQQSGVVAFQRLVDRESQNGPTLIIRGGRPNETAYYLDGYSQQDPLTGNATTTINNNAIQEIVVQNGGFKRRVRPDHVGRCERDHEGGPEPLQRQPRGPDGQLRRLRKPVPRIPRLRLQHLRREPGRADPAGPGSWQLLFQRPAALGGRPQAELDLRRPAAHEQPERLDRTGQGLDSAAQADEPQARRPGFE
jgi:hypothetical protein